MQNTLGERIKKIRADETQASFGDHFGVSRNTILRYESGQNDPPADFIAALCKHYRINPSWLLMGEEPMRTEECINELAKDDMFAIGRPRSNTELQTQHLVTLAHSAKQLIEIRGTDRLRKKAINHIVVKKDKSIEYYAGNLNCDRPQREAEVVRVREACLGSGCEISCIYGTRKYLSFGKELDLLESLEVVQSKGGDILGELEKYIENTGVIRQPIEGSKEGAEFESLSNVVELKQLITHAEIRDSLKEIYLPETIALADAIDRLFRSNSQFKRSELTMMTLSFLKQHGLSEDSQ
jgi:transcriptional regulator with XRE-family HTH domain